MPVSEQPTHEKESKSQQDHPNAAKRGRDAQAIRYAKDDACDVSKSTKSTGKNTDDQGHHDESLLLDAISFQSFSDLLNNFFGRHSVIKIIPATKHGVCLIVWVRHP